MQISNNSLTVESLRKEVDTNKADIVSMNTVTQELINRLQKAESTIDYLIKISFKSEFSY